MGRVVICAADRTVEHRCIKAAVDDKLRFKPVVCRLHEFSTYLYRDPESIGLFWMVGPTSAAMTVRQIRLANVINPIMALVEGIGDAERQALSRAIVLAAGADDAQQDRIHHDELVARLNALARRCGPPDPDTIEIAGGTFNPSTGDFNAAGMHVQFTGKETAILGLLTSRAGTVFSKENIMSAVYHGRDEPHPKIIDVFICKLRKKLASVSGGLNYIESRWGQGYSWVADGFVPAGYIRRQEGLA